MKKLKQTQVFTPKWATNQMVDMLDQDWLSADETFFFEPSCGDGQMLIVIIERMFTALLAKYDGDQDKAMAETLHKFYAIELDETLVPAARTRIWKWSTQKLERELTYFEQYMIAQSLRQSVECRDFFETIKLPVLDTPGIRAIGRKAQR
jgi:hypothetical protein